MLLVYFIKKDGDRGWGMATSAEAIDKYIKENDSIDEYYVTVNDIEYKHMKSRIEFLENRIENIKETLTDIAERY